MIVDLSKHHVRSRISSTNQNLSERPRRGAVINVFRDGVCSASNDELLAGVPPVPAGQKMDGQVFPLLFDPAAQNRGP